MISTSDKGFTLEQRPHRQNRAGQRQLPASGRADTDLCSNSLMKFSYSCRHKESDRQGRGHRGPAAPTHIPNRARGIDADTSSAKNPRPELLGSGASLSAASSQLHGGSQEALQFHRDAVASARLPFPQA